MPRRSTGAYPSGREAVRALEAFGWDVEHAKFTQDQPAEAPAGRADGFVYASEAGK